MATWQLCIAKYLLAIQCSSIAKCLLAIWQFLLLNICWQFGIHELLND